MESEQKDIACPGLRALRAQAAQALADMMQTGKVSAGDLIKIMGMEEAAEEDAPITRDFRICVVDE